MKQVGVLLVVAAGIGAVVIVGVREDLPTNAEEPEGARPTASKEISTTPSFPSLTPPEQEAAPGREPDTDTREESSDAASEQAAGDWEARVLAQPRWSATDEEFVAKYEGFSDDEIRRAKQLVKDAVRDDQEAWIPRRLSDGDYVDLTHASEEGRTLKNVNRQRMMTGTVKQLELNGELRTLQFLFNEQDYPGVYYRAREQSWLIGEMGRRKITE